MDFYPSTTVTHHIITITIMYRRQDVRRLHYIIINHADNPINRYFIAIHTSGLKYNDDGSLDIYFQRDNPGKDKK